MDQGSGWAGANMKLKTQSHVSSIHRSAKQLSIGGMIGLALLATSAVAQDATPGFTPGSVLDSVPLSSLEEPGEPVIVLPPSDQPTGKFGVWSPPATQVSVSPATQVSASPAPQVSASPATQVSASPAPQVLASPDWSPPDTPVPPPAFELVDDVVDELIEQSSPSDESGQALLTPPTVAPEDFDTTKFLSWQSIGSESQTAQVLTTPTMESLPSEVPQIPAMPEMLSQANQSVSPSLSMDTVADDFGRSIIANDIANQAAIESAATMDNFKVGDFPSGESGVVRSQLGPTPLRNILGGVSSRLAGDETVHATGQLTFLSFGRDYRGKGRSLSNGVPNLSANGPDEGDFTGVDINYGRRRSGGKGWEMRFMGFDPDAATDVSGSGPSLAWGGIVAPLTNPNTPETFGLSGIGLNGFSMADLFEDANYHRVTRDSEFGSFEFNFLRATAGSTRLSCGNSVVEVFGGLRAVTFDETMTFTAGATQSAIFPRTASYSSEVKNALFGLQVGGRLERKLSKGWGYTFGTRVGIFNNRVESRQRAEYRFDDGSTAAPMVLFGADAGREFDFSGNDNELAFLGELDFGVVYQFRPRARARVGYRGIAVTNVADAAGQFEDDLFDIEAVAEPKAFSDYIVGGLYFGVDYAF